MVKKCKKPSLGPHYGRVQNPISTFTAAYAFIQNHPGKIYTTRPRNGNGKDFEAFATVSQKGKRKGDTTPLLKKYFSKSIRIYQFH